MDRKTIEYKNYYISQINNSTYESNGKLIGETALVFTEKGKKRFWILKYDRTDDYKKISSLKKAKEFYAREHNKGQCAFWTDAEQEEVDKILKK